MEEQKKSGPQRTRLFSFAIYLHGDLEQKQTPNLLLPPLNWLTSTFRCYLFVMHSTQCSPTCCFCSPPRISARMSLSHDLLLLRAKLALSFFSEPTNDTTNILNRDRCLNACPDAPELPWPPVEDHRGENTRARKDTKRHVILNSMTWDVKEARSEAAARSLSNNPPLECGGGIVLWGKPCKSTYGNRAIELNPTIVNDIPYRCLKKASRKSLDREKSALPAFFDRLLHKAILQEVKQYADCRRSRAELENTMGVKLAKGGTLLYYELCRALWNMRTESRIHNGKVVQRGGNWRVTGVVEDSDDAEDGIEVKEVIDLTRDD